MDQNLEYENEASASSKQINLELFIPTRVASPVYTGGNINGEVGNNGENEPIKVILVDSQTRQQVTTGPESSTKVKLVLIHGDFEDDQIWTHEEFNNNIVDEWENKKNLLLGDLFLVLKDGIGSVGEIRIKHDSEHLKNVRFRLGVMVDDDCAYEIKAAITNPFEVKDKRNLKRLGPLSMKDAVWRLTNISKKGNIRRRLEKKQVWTVRHFVDMYNSNAQELQEICQIKGKKWDMTVNQAKTSTPENVSNVYARVGSVSQQSNSNTMPSFDYNCDYKHQPCDPNYLHRNVMIEDCNFSYLEVPLCDMSFLASPTVFINGGKGKSELAKKRWMKLRATILFWLVSFMKKVKSCVGALHS